MDIIWFYKTIEGDNIEYLSTIKIAILINTYIFVVLARIFTSEADGNVLKQIIGRANLPFDYMFFVKKVSSSEYRKKCLTKTVGQIIFCYFLIVLSFICAKTSAVLIVILIAEAVCTFKKLDVLKPDGNLKLG